MAAEVWSLDPRSPSPELLERAAARLRRGELVAFPTETVYGLGALALEADFVRRIFEAKGRPPHNPVIVHVPSLAEARRVGDVPPLGEKLAAALWPGPLTLVVPRRPEVPDVVTAGGPTVAIRAPSHPVARAFLAAVGAPVAAPSANRSTLLSPTTAAHVVASLGDRISLVLDGGSCSVGIESTVVDVTGASPVILRPGSISRAALEAACGERVLSREVLVRGGPARSPGLLDRHYAPRTPLLIVSSEELSTDSHPGARILALAPREGDVSLPRDPDAYAAGLYAALHRLDGTATLLLVEAPPTDEAWDAVWDRLRRAAHEGP